MKKNNLNGVWFGLTGLACAGVLSGVVMAQTSSQSGTQSPSAPSNAGAAGIASQRQVFLAQLSPANPSISAATAVARIVVEGNAAGVFIQGSGLSPNVMHPQHIHLGTACADLSADANGDGIIDPVEAAPISGPEAVPLTIQSVSGGAAGSAAGGASNESLSSRAQNYPVASQSGNITYLGLFSTRQLQSALSAQMPAPSVSPTMTFSPTATATPIATSSPGMAGGMAGARPSPTASASLSPSTGASSASFLEGRVVEIHGVGSEVTLPSTVAADPDAPGLPASETVPVACGILHQIQE